MSEQALYWDSSFEIVQALMTVYQDVDIHSVGMEELYRLIVALPQFSDDPLLVNDGILTDILREWFEESSH